MDDDFSLSRNFHLFWHETHPCFHDCLLCSCRVELVNGDYKLAFLQGEPDKGQLTAIFMRPPKRTLGGQSSAELRQTFCSTS